MEDRDVVRSDSRGLFAVLDCLLNRVGGERSEIWIKFMCAVNFANDLADSWIMTVRDCDLLQTIYIYFLSTHSTLYVLHQNVYST